LTKELAGFQKDLAQSAKKEMKSAIAEYKGIHLLTQVVELDATAIKDILFQLKGEVDNFVGVIGGKTGDKCSLSIIASDAIVNERQFHAGNIVREVSGLIQGGGGGQAFFATAGGKKPDGLQAAIDAVVEKL